jgi:hypothetical protein
MRMVCILSPPPLVKTYFHGLSIVAAFAIPKMLTQTLSNPVTGNENLLDQFWVVHMALPEEQSVLM